MWRESFPVAGAFDDDLVAGVGQAIQHAVAQDGVIEETQPFVCSFLWSRNCSRLRDGNGWQWKFRAWLPLHNRPNSQPILAILYSNCSPSCSGAVPCSHNLLGVGPRPRAHQVHFLEVGHMVVDQKVRVILVVDDEPDVEPMFRQRMRREIRAGQYEFLFASSGLAALAILSDRTDIELVITDLNMPDMDGLELLAAMEDSFPGLPSMVVSAYGEPDRMARASEQGAGAFVVKPVDFPAFRELLSSSLALSGS